MTKEIAEPTKRIVRQVAGFGCCKCGNPIFQYHHIVKDSDNPDEIMLLCPEHHDEATKRAMLIEEQWGYKNNPFNINRGFASGYLKLNQTAPVISLGQNEFIGTGDLLTVDEEPILSLYVEEGRLELSLKLYDQKDKLIAEIKNNEWLSGDPLPWDIEASYQWLRIRRKPRDITFSLDVRTTPIKLNADIWSKRQSLHLNPEELHFNTEKTKVTLANMCYVAMRFEADTTEQIFTISPDSRFGTGSIIRELPQNKRVEKGLSVWKELNCIHEFSVIKNNRKYSVSLCSKCGKVRKEWTTNQ